MQDATIRNPPSGGVLLLKPCQKASLHLPGGDGEWTGAVSSDFLAQESLRQSSDAVFGLVQVFNMTEWAEHSCVHLGTFTATRNYKGPNKDLRSEIRAFPVVMVGSNEDAMNVLTVIDPKDEAIVMYPHQLLEVVQTAVGDVRQEAYIRGTYPFEEVTLRRALLAQSVEPEEWPYIDRTMGRMSLNPDLPTRIKPPDEFWTVPHLARAEYRTFQLTPGAAKQVNRLKNQIVWACDIALTDPDNIAAEAPTIEVGLCVRGQLKERLGMLPNRKKVLQLGREAPAKKKYSAVTKRPPVKICASEGCKCYAVCEWDWTSNVYRQSDYCYACEGRTNAGSGWQERAPMCAEFGCTKRVEKVHGTEEWKARPWEMYCPDCRWTRRHGSDKKIITLTEAPREKRTQGRYQRFPGMVANPTNDTWEFCPDGENVLVVELDILAGKWEYEITGLVDKSTDPKIDVIGLEPRTADYGEVQRFCVLPRKTARGRSDTSQFLGSVRFFNPEIPLFPRRVNVWLSDEPEQEQGEQANYRVLVTVSEEFGPLSAGAGVVKFSDIDPSRKTQKKRRNR